MQLTITHALALLPGLSTREDWLNWAKSPTLPVDEKWSPSPARVSKLNARRMSQGVRLATEVSLALNECERPEALVFSSRFGELARGEKVIRQLLEADSVSPTDFMVSVHNTAVGMASMQLKAPIPSTSVSSGGGEFLFGTH